MSSVLSTFSAYTQLSAVTCTQVYGFPVCLQPYPLDDITQPGARVVLSKCQQPLVNETQLWQFLSHTGQLKHSSGRCAATYDTVYNDADTFDSDTKLFDCEEDAEADNTFNVQQMYQYNVQSDVSTLNGSFAGTSVSGVPPIANSFYIYVNTNDSLPTFTSILDFPGACANSTLYTPGQTAPPVFLNYSSTTPFLGVATASAAYPLGGSNRYDDFLYIALQSPQGGSGSCASSVACNGLDGATMKNMTSIGSGNKDGTLFCACVEQSPSNLVANMTCINDLTCAPHDQYCVQGSTGPPICVPIAQYTSTF